MKDKEPSAKIRAFEQQYGTDFGSFRTAWHQGLIPNRHSYEVEKDYREWEAAVTDYEQLRQMLENLL